MSNLEFVFGYGSLVNVVRLEVYLGRERFESDELFFCRLWGYHRTWNIAMDNRLDIPGYKFYVDSNTGLRPDIYVTFLNVRRSCDSSIAGVLFRVDSEQLAELDRRERNYQRIEITNMLDRPVKGRVWVYVGLPEAEQRFKLGLLSKTAVIDRDYFELICEAYLSQGEEAAADYLATTVKPTVPLMKLKRIDLSAGL